MRWVTVIGLLLMASAAWALEPSEKLEDPVLEARARALDFEIRCVQCQSESLASSNADWARDARRSIREQIAGGATDAEVKAWFVARYGEFVLMDPPKTGANLILWVVGPVMLFVGIGSAVFYARRRQTAQVDADLSPQEEARLKEILDE